jgi:alginate O-acetyltransferase complex protein AlgI
VVFSSAAFLFLFLPLFLAGYYAMPSRFRSGWILAGSWFYYGFWRVDFLLLMIGTSMFAWFVGTRIARNGDRPRYARAWRSAGVVLPLLVLAYFKYFNFGIDTLSGISTFLGGGAITAWSVVLPVGISFYTFQIISYVVDVYRGTVPPGRSFVEVAAYISLFPQLVAGPIVRYKQIAYQFREREHGWNTFATGARRFMIGLARKVLIADAVAPIANAVFTAESPSFVGAWLGLLAYAVQIYFDFAAYSDMAIGLGRMMGFSLPENFDMPYRSGSITEFWRRWHMTLSAWLRDYLYIPLGGNRRGWGRTLVNLMTVMVLGGLWHGASWSFVLWGAWHGIWLIAERVTFKERAAELRSLPYRLVTLLAVLAGWVVFRAENLQTAWGIFGGLVGAHGFALEATLSWQFSAGAITAIAAGVVISAVEPLVLRLVNEPHRPIPVLHALSGAAVSFLFVISVVRLLASSYSPFLYFRF